MRPVGWEPGHLMQAPALVRASGGGRRPAATGACVCYRSTPLQLWSQQYRRSVRRQREHELRATSTLPRPRHG